MIHIEMVSDMTHQEFAEIYLNYVVMAFANLAPHVVNISNVVPDSWNWREKRIYLSKIKIRLK